MTFKLQSRIVLYLIWFPSNLTCCYERYGCCIVDNIVEAVQRSNIYIYISINAFYDELDRLLTSTQKSDKLFLLGDLNARLDRDFNICTDVIGHDRLGMQNSNEARLLETCAVHQLVVSNTLFRLSDKQKTSWMHPRSRHWHLADYVITRRRDIRDVKVARAMRGAECWTDHRLIKPICSCH